MRYLRRIHSFHLKWERQLVQKYFWPSKTSKALMTLLSKKPKDRQKGNNSRKNDVFHILWSEIGKTNIETRGEKRCRSWIADKLNNVCARLRWSIVWRADQIHLHRRLLHHVYTECPCSEKKEPNSSFPSLFSTLPPRSRVRFFLGKYVVVLCNPFPIGRTEAHCFPSPFLLPSIPLSMNPKAEERSPTRA